MHNRVGLFAFALFSLSCAKEDALKDCAPALADLSLTAGAEGMAFAFVPDPISSSGQTALDPNNANLDEYRTDVNLKNLKGHGVLDGSLVSVRKGLECQETFGAFSETNDFRYSHSEGGFQEAMTYHFGDRFRNFLGQAGVTLTQEPIRIIAHCMKDDNAFFVRYLDFDGKPIQKVCLGDSISSPGSSYADDASVALHELQHESTVNAYHPIQLLNRYWVDEAGALNEAISDFMALLFLEDSTKLDPKVFSRWALGKYIAGVSNQRGAHLCPSYDSSYPQCAFYQNGASGFSAQNAHISYSYPDGLGWPHPDNFKTGTPLKTIFESYSSQEEIHNLGVLLSGALWDAYEALLDVTGDKVRAKNLMAEAVHEAIKHLPKPTSMGQSPVNFQGLAAEISLVASTVGMTAAEAQATRSALAARGLIDHSNLPSGWAAVGPGTDANPGIKVEDNPNRLRTWLSMMGGNPDIVTQGIATGLNAKLDPGEVAVVWFDVQNNSALTAGDVELEVESLSSNVRFFDNSLNDGALTESRALIKYFKINGNDIVNALSPGNSVYGVQTARSYFRTNPYFSKRWYTGLWIKVSPLAGSQNFQFRVTLRPSNGAQQTINFSAMIQ